MKVLHRRNAVRSIWYTVLPLVVGRLGSSGFLTRSPSSTKCFTASSRMVSRVFRAYFRSVLVGNEVDDWGYTAKRGLRGFPRAVGSKVEKSEQHIAGNLVALFRPN